MPGINLNEVSNLEFVKSFKWEFIVKPPTGIALDENEFVMRVTTTNLPTRTNTPIEVQVGPHTVTVDGKVEFDRSINSTCTESPGMICTDMIETWLSLIQDTKTGKGNLKSAVRGEIIAKLLGENDEVLATYEVASVSPQSMTGAELGTDSEIMRPNIVWNYETYEYTKGSSTGNSK